MKRYIEANCLYRHYKGGLYYVIGIAGDHDYIEEFVVYHSIEDDCEMFIRPVQDFLSKTPIGGSRIIGQEYRFERIETFKEESK